MMHRKKRARVRANGWRPEGVLFNAYRGVGAASAGGRGEHENALGRTHRECEVSSAVAELHHRLQASRIASKFVQASVESRVDCMVLNRNYDATPVACTFGAMQDLVAPYATYFVEDKTNPRCPWKAVSLDEWRALGRKAKPGRGSLQILAQRLEIGWVLKDSDGVDMQEILIPPIAMANGKSSTLYSATEKAVEDLSLDKLLELARHIKFIIVNEIPDQCSANVRKKAATISALLKIDNVFYNPFQCCMAHTLHRLMARSFREEDIIGDIHAIAYVMTLTPQRNAMLTAFRALLEEEAEFIEDEDPPSASSSAYPGCFGAYDWERVAAHLG